MLYLTDFEQAVKARGFRFLEIVETPVFGPTHQDFKTLKITAGPRLGLRRESIWERADGARASFTYCPRWGFSWAVTADGVTTTGREPKKLGRTLVRVVRNELLGNWETEGRKLDYVRNNS